MKITNKVLSFNITNGKEEKKLAEYVSMATKRGYILGQKRNAAWKTYIVYGSLSQISSKRFVIVRALILGLWVPVVVLAIIVIGRNWFSSLNLRFYRSWRRVIMRWRHECTRSDIVPICQKRFLRRSIILAWHRNWWAITDGVTLACNILIAFSFNMCPFWRR